MAKKPDGRGGRPIIVKREEVVEGGHHGGAWKVAYADFVTAMMAFFLLMWLLNATTEDQRRGLADYFAPQGQMSNSTSGSGAPFGGRTPYEKGSLVSDRGAMSVMAGKSTAQPDSDDEDSDSSPQPLPARTVERNAATADDSGKRQPGDTANGKLHAGAASLGESRAGSMTEGEAHRGQPALITKAARLAAPDAAERATEQAAEQARAEAARREHAAFERAAQQIRDAVHADPALAALAHQLAIDITPEGLRVQIIDEDRQPMFATGSAVLHERARLLLQKIGPVLARLSEPISISGHTDAAPYRGADRSNWELSSERANATRRLLIDAGLQEERLRSVTGNADRDPLLPDDPLAAANRRIAIMVLRAAPAAMPVPANGPAAVAAPAP